MMNRKLLGNFENDEDKKEFESSFNSCSFVREVLANELISMINKSIKEGEKKNNYELPGWSERQADLIGYRRALRDALALLGYECKEIING